MVRTTSASKGLAYGILLIVVVTALIAIISVILIATQTDFITGASRYLGSLLTLKLP